VENRELEWPKMSVNTCEAIKAYFQAKSKELQALAGLPICEHSGLKGSHREQIYRTYLSDILPRRYEVGRGMVYGMGHRSREADIVIWDSHDYPALPLLDHSFHFAESVKCVIECKSNWSSAHLSDALEKCEAVKDIIMMKEPSLADEIAMLQLDVSALKANQNHEGMMICNPHISTAAMFLRGGHRLIPKDILRNCSTPIDDAWPDVLILLEPGIVALKNYPDRGRGRVAFFKYGADALLAFSTALLRRYCKTLDFGVSDVG
jgi:uncharacterized protein DUF6602